ncbi:capsular exopolysaccharide family [Thalassolituus maritimus]|uniref:Capsular exopolysaccharide family n=1 Tax=Thalassolituus maritimus TaxID=484498 RepID=A0A1N7LMF8_9GAMM|nr:polysaccharide biosynthesis tyrosine autokinase [Thalassolituus maritimus]SIS74974.1 capsular exopolysaccharide family [Thalassolituus maritimus]
MNNQSGVEVVNLTHYWQVVRRQLKKIVLFSLVISAIAALVALVLTPLYQATATIMIEAEEAKVLSIEEVYGLASQSDEYFKTQFEILKSRELARRVVKKMKLTDVAEFNRHHPSNKKSFSLREVVMGEGEPATEEDIISDTIDTLMSVIEVSPIRKTQLVKVSVESKSPALAANIANEIANQFIESQLDAKVKVTQQAAGWLTDRLGGLKAKLEESERRLQEYREENNLVDVEGVSTLVAKEIDQITEKLVEARSQRLELEGTYQQLVALGELTFENLSSLPSIISNPVVVNLRDAETQAELKVSELKKRYGPLHPKMIAAESDLEAVRESVLTQMKRIATSIESKYLVAKAKETSLQIAFTHAKSDVKDINRTEFMLNEYQREVRTNKQLYDAFFSRISETTATGDLQTANARVVDPAVEPASPVKPKRKLIVLLALVVSGMFGVALALLLDILDSTIKNLDDVERKLDVPMLGLLPLVGKKHDAGDAEQMVRAFVGEGMDGFRESVRTLRTGLTLASMEQPASVILVTSSVPSEGKTTTSTNVAEAFGQMEKTLLIDCDMRRPSVAKKLGLAPNVPGLSNAVAYPDMLDECIQSRPELGIDVVSAGPIPPNPLELLGSKNFRDILDTLRGRYQRIIIDSAPMQAVSDALYLSTLVDGVVYVVKADATKDKLAQDGLSKLDNNNARVLGVVLNQVNIDREAKYADSYAGYYDVYGYSSKSVQG